MNAVSFQGTLDVEAAIRVFDDIVRRIGGETIDVAKTIGEVKWLRMSAAASRIA